MDDCRTILVLTLLAVAACSPAADSTIPAPPPTVLTSTTTTLVATTTTAIEEPPPPYDGPYRLDWETVDFGFGGQQIEAIDDLGDGFVAVAVEPDGSNPTLWTTSDGVSWSGQPIDLPGFEPSAELVHLSAGGAGFVLRGATEPGLYAAEDLTWVSPDGRSWDRVGTDDLGVSVPDRPYRQTRVEVSEAAVSAEGMLIGGYIHSELDADLIVDEFFPDLPPGDYQIGYWGDEGTLVVIEGEENQVGTITLEELGYGGVYIEEVIEGGGDRGLWYSSDGQEWHRTHPDPERSTILHLGTILAVGDAILLGTEDMDGYGPQGPRASLWRTYDGVDWEMLPRESGDVVFDSIAQMGDRIALTETLGTIATAPIPHFLIMEPDGTWVDGRKPWDGHGTWYAMPALAGGPLGVVASHSTEVESCREIDCQFFPDDHLMLSLDGEQWSAPEAASDLFGTNSVVLDIAVATESVLAFVVNETVPEEDPHSLWLGVPEPTRKVSRFGFPTRGGSIYLHPVHDSSVTTQPTQDFGFHVQDFSGYEIEQVFINGEEVVDRDEGGSPAATLPLDEGENTFVVEIVGNTFEVSKTLRVRYLPDADIVEGLLLAVEEGSIVFDVGAWNYDDEFPSWVDPAPGVGVEFTVADDVDVNLWCDFRGVPYWWFMERFNTEIGMWEWLPFELTVHDGEIVQFIEQCWG